MSQESSRKSEFSFVYQVVWLCWEYDKSLSEILYQTESGFKWSIPVQILSSLLRIFTLWVLSICP